MQSKAGKRAKRLLSLLLALVMCIGMLPGVALAADTATWEAVELSEIQPTDTIAITMYGSATQQHYVMENDGGTQTYGPAAIWDSSNTTDTTWHWNVVSTTDGYTIYPAGRVPSLTYGYRAGYRDPPGWFGSDQRGSFPMPPFHFMDGVRPADWDCERIMNCCEFSL